MHSLTVPADPKTTLLESADTTSELLNWLDEKLEVIAKRGISLERIIFDPGIGFGKTPSQSIEILRQIELFKNQGLRTLAGHSRKSFMKSFSDPEAKKRDLESIGLSLALCEKGVDFLRVHEPEKHIKAHMGYLNAY